MAHALAYARHDLIGLGAGDAPLLAPAIAELHRTALLSIEDGAQGAWLVDPEGSPQPLASMVQRQALLDVLQDAEHASLKERLSRLELQPVAVPASVLRDVDTPDDVEYVLQILAQYAAEEGKARHG